MKRIAINRCYGGFDLSERAIELYKAKSRMDKDDVVYSWGIKRNDPILIEVIDELGAEANGPCAELHIVSIPDDVEWEIEEYDGNEWVSEVHRTWS